MRSAKDYIYSVTKLKLLLKISFKWVLDDGKGNIGGILADRYLIMQINLCYRLMINVVLIYSASASEDAN